MTPGKCKPWQEYRQRAGSTSAVEDKELSASSLTRYSDCNAVFDGSLRESSGLSPQCKVEISKTVATARAVLGQMDLGFREYERKLGELQNRLSEGRIHLAVLGQFKRGKSTLLNAILGNAVLPVALVPLTAVPTFVRSGDMLAARVQFENDRPPAEFMAQDVDQLNEFLGRFVTESANPENELGVRQVEVSHPADLLRHGAVLIDTPGIGSTFRHNTEATLNFLPQCDAALFVVSADPPITEVEVEFLKTVRARVARMFFILNKADYLSDVERQEAVAFLKQVLTNQAGFPEDVPILCVSARQAVSARQSGDRELWRRSSMESVEKQLFEFLVRERHVALGEAVSRKVADIAGEAVTQIQLTVRSLQMPLDDLEKRLRVFEQRLKEIERERIAVRDIIEGDHRRMQAFLEEQAEVCRSRARSHFKPLIDEHLPRCERGVSAETQMQQVLEQRLLVYFEHEMGEMTQLFKNRVAEALRQSQIRADKLIQSVRQTASELFDVPYHAPHCDETYEVVREPYWITHKWSSSLNPIPPGTLERALPKKLRFRRVHKRLSAQLEALVLHNVENLRWSTLQSLNDTFARFAAELDQRLADTVAATHGAIQAAVTRRKTHQQNIAGQVTRLEDARTALDKVRQTLVSGRRQ